MSNENQNQQNTEEKKEQSTKKEGWIKFSCGMTAVIAVSAALGYVAGFATTKLLSK
jgi:hypothetical protein|nr:MAG TPA: hypothetical protein [Bacteriophage sp.]DAR91952.1 MAG TPA: hypothetical protein [Bacteriophage sp.]